MTATIARRKLPLRPLIYATGAETIRDAADLLGVSRRQAQRWEATGTVSIATAEKAAHRIGRHPADIWPGDEYYNAVLLRTPRTR